MLTKHGRAYVTRPFKGNWFYEWQIMMVVLQFRHSDACWYAKMCLAPTRVAWWQRVHVWIDSAWR